MNYFELTITNRRKQSIVGKSTHTKVAQALQMAESVGEKYKAIGEKPRTYKWLITNESETKEEGELFEMCGSYTLSGKVQIREIILV